MIRILRFIAFLYIGLVLASCTSRSPILSQPGITHIGPTDGGLGNPIWSPSGKSMVATHITNVHSWSSEIFILDLSTNQIRSIEKTDYGNLKALSWSPDGTQIAFSSERGGDWPEGIWLVDVIGTAQKQLLTEGYDATWSPDGNNMAIFSTLLESGNETRVLSILDLKTMNKNVVFSGMGKYTDTQGLAWSPDGTKLMFSFGKQGKDAAIRFSNVDIYVLEISTGKITKITNDGINSDPKWSPNSSLIAYIKHTAGDLDFKIIVSYDDGRCSRQITTSAYSTDWSPDGKQLAFDYAGNIYALDLAAFLGEGFQRPDYLCS